jgi:SNF family Na+-dependent transporter
MADEKHESWNNDVEFWLVYLGAVVGYGCIWRFPYLMYENGGITFLIPFFTILIIVGTTQTYIQSAIGQYFREPITQIYSRVSRKWAGAAIMNCMIVLIFSVYYILLLAYCLMYLCLSFMNPWPWASETPEADSKSSTQKSALDRTGDFYNKYIIGQRDDVPMGDLGGFHWPLLAAFIASWLLCYVCLRNGVKQTGRIAWITALGPYVLLVVLAVRVLFLDGWSSGVLHLLRPDFSKLFTWKVWFDAAGQIFFQLGNGFGINQTLASFRKVNAPLVKFATWGPMINGLTGVFTSCIIFGYLGYYSKLEGIPINEYPIQGPA